MALLKGFEPLKHKNFAVLWTATLVSNIGTWMFNVASGWLMTDIAASPLMVSMVQTATSLPIFLFALTAGAFGDMFDRRKLLMITQIACGIACFIFVALLANGIISETILLFFTFIMGTGTAFALPAWQAIVPKLVPRLLLPSALALNGVSMNVARAIGPALGGFILASVGAVLAVLLNGISYLIVAASIWWWKSEKPATGSLPREYLVGAVQAGVRFSLHSKAHRHTLARAAAFFICASGYWALLPLVAKELLGGGPGIYGMLLTSLGVGAVAGTFFLGWIRERFNADMLVALATAGTALTMLIFAQGRSEATGILAGLIGGFSWVAAVSSLNLSVQLALPDWVRSRGMAMFQMVLFGSMAAGSIIWGRVGTSYGLPISLTAAACLMLLLVPLTWRFKLNLGSNYDHTPSGHWPEPMLTVPIAHDHGPVMVTVEYRIADQDRERFHELIRELGIIRRRDGAAQWGFFEDVEDHGHFIEIFTNESWVAHLRQHARVSKADKLLQDQIIALHQGDSAPKVTHAVTPRRGETPAHLPKRHEDI